LETLSDSTPVIPSGTTMVFYQAVAPTGWTRLVLAQGYALRAVNLGATSSTGFDIGDPLDSQDLPHTHTVASHTHDLGNHTHAGPSHTHSISTDGAHTHTMNTTPPLVYGLGSSVSRITTDSQGSHNHGGAT